MKYAWKKGSGYRVSAQDVGETLEALQEANHGKLMPEDVVRIAENSSSPLHGCFEWSDSAAAREYREIQALRMLRSIKVQVKVRRGKGRHALRSVRAFVKVSERSKAHAMTVTVLDNKTMRTAMLHKAWKELRKWRERYAEYQELAEACAAVDEALDKAKATA